MRAEKGDRTTVRLGARLDDDTLRRAERLVGYVSRRFGRPATRPDVLREALLRGLTALESARDPGDNTRRR
jgi:DNA-directed RNA polymerase specialized sigma24 family protein